MLGDIDVRRKERTRKLDKYKCRMQPTPAVIGLDPSEIEQSYVILNDNYRFEVDSPLKAVDITFKCIHALHLHYSSESGQMWQFLQQAVYGINRDPQFDPHYSKLSSLCKEFELNNK